jgi:pimeloyl-ACP methyl ester carboxylesterase
MTLPVVFLHGAGFGGWMWRQQVETLTQLRCLTPDLPGHGANLGLPWTSIRDGARWVAELIAREAGGRAHIVGLSLGAVVGYELITAFPESVDRLVLSGGNGAGRTGRSMMSRFMRAIMPLARTRPMVAATLAAMKVPKEDRPKGHRAMAEMSAESLATMVEQVLAYRLDEVLRSRPHRVLAIAGSMEAPMIRRTVRRLAEMMPNAEAREVPRGLHTWNWQYPELFARTVTDWLLP